MKTRMALLGVIVICLISTTGRCADGSVTLSEDDRGYTIANSFVTLHVAKGTGDLTSLKYKGLELVGSASGHPGGYWSHTPTRGSHIVNAITINPADNQGERAEISVKGFYQGTPLGSGPGGSAICDIEIRYTLSRNDSGPYTYSIFTHQPDYPATSIGEARFAVKLNEKVFDYMTIDANRRKVMPKPEDWDKGTQLNMKEVRRLNTGRYAGQVEHKYDYSAIQFEIPAFGWSSTEHKLGLWFVNSTIEYLSGGATKVELTGHLDNNEGAAPTLLNYWRGSHYGSSVCNIAQGESWTKVIGPFQIYCNAATGHDEMWKDALTRANTESNAWPYAWVSGVDYPHKSDRGSARGRLVLDDKLAKNGMSNILVGLAHPDYSAGRGGRVDWQQDARYYQFWTRADANGRFNIANIRPGAYTLHAIADGVLGEFAKTDVTIATGQSLELGDLSWQPVRKGAALWEIGVANRSAEEFKHGDHYWQWGLYNEYPKDFPDDVNFVIGKSDFHKDWNYAQCPRADRPDGTTWSVTFNHDGAAHGRATLRMGLAAVSARSIQVAVNGQPAGTVSGLMNTSTIHRDGIRGYWVEREVAFDAALLKSGENVLKLTIPPGDARNGIEYDYLRLELQPIGDLER